MLNNDLLLESRGGGYRLHLISIFFSIFVLLLLGGHKVYAIDANVSDGNADFSFNAFIRDADVIDGTADWDSNDEAGNDSGPKNGIVRTFDTVTYPVKVTINPKNGQTLRNIKIRLTGTLHDGFKDGRAVGRFAVGNQTDMTDVKNGKVSFTQDYTIEQSGNAVMIPVTIEVQGAKPDQMVYPDMIKVQVMSIDGESVEGVSATFNDLKKIRVSAKVSLAVKGSFGFSIDSGNKPYILFNPNVSKDDRSVMSKTSFSIMGVPLSGKNSVRGSTFPTGRIRFSLRTSGRVKYDGHTELNRVLNPNTELPKLFDVFAISGNYDYIESGSENTLSYSLGTYTNKDTRVTYHAASSIKYASSNPENAVWDSGNYHILNQYVDGDELVYDGYIDDYEIGNVFPTRDIYNKKGYFSNYATNEKAFSTQSFMFLDKNLFSYKNPNNDYEISNNFEFKNTIQLLSYEDENGRVIPLNYEKSIQDSIRNEFGDGASIVGRLFSSTGGVIGTSNPSWEHAPQGDESILGGQQDVLYYSEYCIRSRTMGGVKFFTKWNSDSFKMDKAAALSTNNAHYDIGYKDYFGSLHRYDKEHMVNYFGVAKNKDNSFDVLTKNKMSDYDWYTIDQIDEALAKGPISAFVMDVYDDILVDSYNSANYHPIRLHVISNKIGSLNEKGTYNIVMSELAYYRDKDRSKEFYCKTSYNNPTRYDSDGNIVEMQSPVKGTVAFDTLAILNAKTSTSVQFDKSTYYISDTPKVTLKSSVSFDNRSSESISDTDMHLKNVLDAPFVYKKNSAYYEKDGKRVYVEPKMTQLTGNRSLLEWTYLVSAKDKSIPDIHYEVTINPLYLDSGVAVSNGIRSIIESNIDKRIESLRSFSASVTLLKIGQVGVAESIEKDFGEKNSDYTIHLQPYTTIEDETGVKGITHVPQNNDKYGSKFHGSTYLKNAVINSTKELLLYVNRQNIEVSDPNQVDVQSNGWMSYEDAKAQGILDEVKTIYFVIPGVLSNKDQPTIDLTFGTKDNQFHDIYYNEVLANSNTHYPTSPISNRVSYQIKADLELALRKIQIYTDLASNGLPVKVYLNKEIVQTAGNEQMYTLNLYQKDSGQKVASKTLKGSDDVSVIKLTVPKEYLAKNAHHEYEVRIEDYDNRYVYVDDAVKKVSTEGYTSAETTIHTVDESLNYKGVVMTEREVGFDQLTYYETVKVPVTSLKKTKTGYGYELPEYVVHYQNELGISQTSPYNPVLNVPKELVDTSLNVQKNDGIASIQLANLASDGDSTIVKYHYQLPEVSIHKGDGLTYLKEDVLKLSETQQKAYIDGGRKLYIPVWLKHLGNYPIHFGGDSRIGVNQVKLDVEQNLNVYAYMYATDYSNTISKDEVMMKPELKQ